MKAVLIVTFACGLFAVAGCSKDPAPAPTAAVAPAANDKPAEKSLPPPELVNVAAADMGGAVEELTGNYGPGFTGRRLVDGLMAPSWSVKQVTNPPPEGPFFPQEAVVSFFEREAAEVEALDIILPEDPSAGPKDVEIWISMTSPYENFSRVAAESLERKSGVQTVEFDAVEAKYVKLKVLSGHSPGAIEIAELRVLESDRRGYTPLFTRAPLAKFWKGSPREGAQRGLDWLQQAGADWTHANGCFGCHVQAQVLMGQAVAFKHDYRVNLRAMRQIYDHTLGQSSWGSWWNPSYSATAFGAMGVAHAMEVLTDIDDKKYPYVDRGLTGESAERLMESQMEDGAQPVDEVNPPIVQGQFMTTGNALVALKSAAARHFKLEVRGGSRAQPAMDRDARARNHTGQDLQGHLADALRHAGPEADGLVGRRDARRRAAGRWRVEGELLLAPGRTRSRPARCFTPSSRRASASTARCSGAAWTSCWSTRAKDPEKLENGSWEAMNTESKKPIGFAAHDVGRDRARGRLWPGAERRAQDRQAGGRQAGRAKSRRSCSTSPAP